jgi:hypothetical protein
LENIFTTAAQVTDTGDTLVTNPFHHHSAKGEIHLYFITNYYHKQKHKITQVARLGPPLSISKPFLSSSSFLLGITDAPDLVLDVAQNNKS